MDKFKQYRIFKKGNINTYFGSITINDYLINPDQFELLLQELIFLDLNLEYIFCEEDIEHNRKKLIKRFVPRTKKPEDVENFVEKKLNNNNFYSFVAEGLLSLIYRDLRGYELTSAVIDFNETLSDSHTGADACLYDMKNQTIILGEAKFYKDYKAGINKIISDFTKTKGFLNKLENFVAHVANNDESNKIVLKNLGKDELQEYSLEEFLANDLGFSGFVLHEMGTLSPEDFDDGKIYNTFNISPNEIIENISKVIPGCNLKSNFVITMFHLPIKSKKGLIVKLIEKAYQLLEK